MAKFLVACVIVTIAAVLVDGYGGGGGGGGFGGGNGGGGGGGGAGGAGGGAGGAGAGGAMRSNIRSGTSCTNPGGWGTLSNGQMCICAQNRQPSRTRRQANRFHGSRGFQSNTGRGSSSMNTMNRSPTGSFNSNTRITHVWDCPNVAGNTMGGSQLVDNNGFNLGGNGASTGNGGTASNGNGTGAENGGEVDSGEDSGENGNTSDGIVVA